MQTFSLLLDGLMVVLLALTLVSVWVLAGRLRYLRDSRQQFEEMVRQFDEATKRADAGVKALQTAASRSGDDLQQRLDRARALRDELSIMIDSADSMARRLESAGSGRAAEAAARQSEPQRGSDPRSKAEMDLLRAMSAGARREGSS